MRHPKPTMELLEPCLCREYKGTVAVNIHSGEPYDVYMGRPGGGLEGPWGNPFPINRTRDRAASLTAYRVYILQRPDLIVRLPELVGKRLGCFCAPEWCHVHVLIGLIRDAQF